MDFSDQHEALQKVQKSVETIEMRSDVLDQCVDHECLVLHLMAGRGHAEHAEVCGESRQLRNLLSANATMTRRKPDNQ